MKEKDKEFKDGDILIDDCISSVFPCKTIFIYKGTRSEDGFYESYVCRNASGTLGINKGCCSSRFAKIRHASEEEKNEFFAEMKMQGLRWNAEEKLLETISYRAKVGESYYFIATNGIICKSVVKTDEINTSNSRYNFFNQFRTEGQAKEAAKRIEETLENYHYELGE